MNTCSPLSTAAVMPLGLILSIQIILSCLCNGDSTIDAVAKHGYGSNVGWINFRGDVTNGTVVGGYVCSGFAWAANVGWIHFGDGNPDNGIQYSNTSAADYGVNLTNYSCGSAGTHEADLRGFAYGSGIGWVQFEATGAPHIDLTSGELGGYVWSTNCGWISLGEMSPHIHLAATMERGADSDEDEIADAWEFEQGENHGNPGNLSLLSKDGDADEDGATDFEEYVADSDPFDSLSYFRITQVFAVAGVPDGIQVEWSSSVRRIYGLQKGDLVTPFADLMGRTAIPGCPSLTSVTFADPLGIRGFYRVGAQLPLSP